MQGRISSTEQKLDGKYKKSPEILYGAKCKWHDPLNAMYKQLSAI